MSGEELKPCLVTHEVFEQRPNDGFIDGWRNHIEATGYPETYSNVSTSKPVNSEGLVILSAQLRVPTTRREGGEWVPCPICSPRRPKFFNGRMAWFPAERTVRFIGHNCAETHFGETFLQADRRFRYESKLRRYLDRWKELQEHREVLDQFAKGIFPIVTALQDIKEKLDSEANGFCELLWSRLVRRSGAIVEARDTGLRDQRGQPVYEDVQLGVVRGYSLLQDNFRPAAKVSALKAAILDLVGALPEWDPTLADAPIENEIMRRGAQADVVPQTLIAQAETAADAQQFFAAENLLLIERAAEYLGFTRLSISLESKQLSLRAKSFLDGHYSRPFLSAALSPIPPIPPELAHLAGQ